MPAAGTDFATRTAHRAPYTFDARLPVRSDGTTVMAIGDVSMWLSTFGKMLEATGPAGHAALRDIKAMSELGGEWSCVLEPAQTGIATLCSSALKPGVTTKAALDAATAWLVSQNAWEAEAHGRKVHDRDDNYAFKSGRGLSREVVENISRMKEEPQWMLDFRLKALDHFLKRPMPNWGPDLSALDLDNIFYYVKPMEKSEKSWDDVPDDIKRTFDKLGVPEAERKFLAGLGAQYESEMVYHSIQEHLEKQGVIFVSIEDGLKKYPDMFREYFGTVIPIEDNKFAALNSAVWSGGSFVYVPKGVKVDLPLQAYFRLNTANVGQFERTMIIVDEGASVHYVEGCTAPQYTTELIPLRCDRDHRQERRASRATRRFKTGQPMFITLSRNAPKCLRMARTNGWMPTLARKSP